MIEESAVKDEAGIELDAHDASPEEKAQWERELLGIALSYNPLMALSMEVRNDESTIVALDQLSEEMEGETINLLGMIAMVTAERARRDSQRFLIVALDLLGGQLEVIIWPESLRRTEEVWRPANTVRVTGKIRLRGDRIELVCETAKEYGQKQLSAINTTAPSAPMPARGYPNSKKKNKPSEYGNTKDQYSSNGDGQTAESKRSKERNSSSVTVEPSFSSKSESQRLVRLILSEEDQKHDYKTLREVISLILEYPRPGPGQSGNSHRRAAGVAGAASSQHQLLQ